MSGADPEVEGADVIVVGAGISGLAAAYALRRADPALRIVVLEGAGRIGGKLRTGEVGGLRVDLGAEAVLARRPEALDLVASLGRTDELRYPATTSAAVALGRRRLVPMPADSVMGVPTDLAAVAASGVLTDAGLARLAAPTAEPVLSGADVSVFAALAPRVGAEVVDRLVEPLLAGVYAGRADRLSLAATLPAVFARLQRTPDAVEAARAARGTPLTGPVFFAPHEGVGSLPEALLAASGATLRLRTPVRSITRDGDGFRLVAGPVPAPVRLRARAVVVATPPPKSAVLLAEVAPTAAYALSEVAMASLALVLLALPADTVTHGSGFLVPSSVGTAVKAATYLTAKWPHLRARPDDPVVVRLSIGRVGGEQVLQRDDPDLVRLARADLATLAGVSAEPIDSVVARWGGGLPQYDVGHLARVARIHAEVGGVPGLAVAGVAYDGVGVPACIGSGQRAATQVLEHLRRTPARLNTCASEQKWS